jgi:hypothetical protein
MIKRASHARILLQVTHSEIETCIGIMHVVDAVLVPAAEDEEDEEKEVAVEELSATGVAQAQQSSEIEMGRRLLTGSRPRKYKRCGRKCRAHRKRARRARCKTSGGKRCRRPRGTPKGTPPPTVPPKPTKKAPVPPPRPPMPPMMGGYGDRK